MHIVLDCDADDDTVRRTPLGGYQLLSACDNLPAIGLYGFADRNLCVFGFGGIGDQVRVFVKDINPRPLLLL
ncbi:hypothetical protein SDC9_160744 [bioreactor metagenome]|uniref:Uncharacterized protein n=1 Tax=bioreactor metagenome TaxID=1076179 RepID=A0A645FMK3_9ZZZZ